MLFNKLCVCFFFFFSGHSLGGEKHINKIPPKKSRDNPVKSLFMCFFFLLFFSLNHSNIPASFSFKLRLFVRSLVALYRLRFGYRFESRDANGPPTSKTQTLRNKGLFFPILSVGSLESVLKGQFHAAIRMITKRCDSCAQGALGRRTVSRRNLCDAELLAKRYRETCH